MLKMLNVLKTLSPLYCESIGCLVLWVWALGCSWISLGSYAGDWFPLFLEVLLTVIFKKHFLLRINVYNMKFQCPAFYPKLRQIIRRNSWIRSVAKGRWAYLGRLSNSTPSHFPSTKSWFPRTKFKCCRLLCLE